MMKYFVSILVLLVSIPVLANDFKVGRQGGMGGGVLMSKPSGSDLVICPSVLFAEKELTVESGYQRKYELADLDEIFLASGYGYRDFAITAGFSQFGKSDYYVEQLIRSSLSYRYKYFKFSLLLSNKRLEIGAEERKVSLSAFSLGASLGIHYEKIHVGFVCDNVNRPKLDEKANAERFKTDIYGEIEGNEHFSVTFRAAFEENEKAIYSIGQYFHILGKHGIFWGIQSDPISYGGGVEINYRGIDFTYALSHHPVLGFSHNVSLGYSFDFKAREKK